jgi:hypothetical protein
MDIIIVIVVISWQFNMMGTLAIQHDTAKEPIGSRSASIELPMSKFNPLGFFLSPGFFPMMFRIFPPIPPDVLDYCDYSDPS